MVRDDDPASDVAGLRGWRAAFNSRDSQSGYNALRDLVAPHAEAGRFFTEAVETGGHLASLAALREGRADVAAIDAVTLALAPEAAKAGLRILQWSRAVPGLPYVTRLNTSDADLARLRHGIAAALADPGLADARAALRLAGFDVLGEAAYAPIVEMERRAMSLGYRELN
jgi:ABC-type phosphate/phosphonate transport system substrate-binding protein